MTYGTNNLTPMRGPNVWARRGYDGRTDRETLQRWIAGTAGLGLLIAGLAHRGTRGAWTAVAGGALLAAAAAGDRSLPQARGWIAARRQRDDRVTQASEESFPASDSPSWTPTAGSESDDPSRRG